MAPSRTFGTTVPQVLEGDGGHVGVAQYAVLLADQLVLGIAGHGHEGGVGMGDDAGVVGARHDQPALGKRHFAVDHADPAAAAVGEGQGVLDVRMVTDVGGGDVSHR